MLWGRAATFASDGQGVVGYEPRDLRVGICYGCFPLLSTYLYIAA